MAQPHNQSVLYRKDDNAVLISTDAYVSHKRQAGPWASTFSMTMCDAKKLHAELGRVISEHDHEDNEQEAFDPTDPCSRMYENEIAE